MKWNGCNRKCSRHNVPLEFRLISAMKPITHRVVHTLYLACAVPGCEYKRPYERCRNGNVVTA